MVLKENIKNLKAEKDRLTDFLKKQDEEKQKIKQESLIKQYSRKIDLYNKMMQMQKQSQKNKKKKKII